MSILPVIAFLALFLSQEIATAPATQLNSPDGQEQAQAYERDVTAHLDTVATLARIHARDQYARKVLIEYFQSNQFSVEERIEFEETFRDFLEAIDDENVADLRPILERYSWQQLADIDPKLPAQAYSIVQHGPLELQKASIDEIRPLAEAGIIPAYTYTNMYDRIAETENRPQRYGTQSICVDGTYILYKYEGTKEEIDARREALGLDPVDDYIYKLNELYNGCGEK